MVEHVTAQSARENLMSNAFEAAVSVLAILSILNVIKVMLHVQTLPPAAREGILSLPNVLIWAWLIVGLAGAIIMLVGVCMSSFTRIGRAVESVGLWFSMGMWLSIGVVDMIKFWSSDWHGYLQYLVIGLACVLRLIALSRVKMAVSRAKREADAAEEGCV